MPTFRAKAGNIYFEQSGARANPRVLMIHGIGCQIVQWPESMIQGLADAGFCVIAFDNRDVGLSFEFDGPPPSVEKLAQAIGTDGSSIDPPYSLGDMAQDAVDLLDHLGQGGAHVVGVSMGGMISQRMAIHHPERVYSLTSIMSSTGNPDLPQPAPEVIGAMLSAPETDEIDAIVAANEATARVIGGPHYDSVELGMGRAARAAAERAYRPIGFVRQLAAILADGSRVEALGQVSSPSLVIHGDADPLVPVEAGRETAASIPGASLHEIEKMGHDLPEPLIPEIVDAIVSHISTVPVAR